MPRNLPISNGNLLVAFDNNYLLREFYFPHVGEENHTKGDPFRFGVWVDGEFSWLGKNWEISCDYLDDTLVTNVVLFNKKLALRILANDIVVCDENIYLKQLTIENLAETPREVRLFFAQDFHILGSRIGDTAVFRPEIKSLLHYKKDRYFLVNIYANKKFGIDFFATGNKEQPMQEGTWRDAEDGILSGNPIAQGSVDSVISVHLTINPKQPETCYYWICAGKNWDEVLALNSMLQKKRPAVIFKQTIDYWKLWVDKEQLNFSLLPEKLAKLYQRSLLILRTQIDNSGSIIAANDSDAIYFNRDTYSYMWPRDGALTAYALDLAGFAEITCRFFNFCSKIIEKDGYFLHKYTPSGMLASSWHPWEKDGVMQLPIQEDETALVIWALWQHFNLYKDIEFIKPLYRSLIKNAADFMMNYRDAKTHLPMPSYDIWEERQGVFTYTAAAVVGGLVAAANFAKIFGDIELAKEYEKGANDLREAMVKYLYLEVEQRFCRGINFNPDGVIKVDATVDSSLFGLFAFGAFPANDQKVKNTMQQVYAKLWCHTPVGGLARYEDDVYYRKNNDIPGNPWFVTTLWYAEYLIHAANTREELDLALPILEWVCEHALTSGVLAEQVDPYTNEPLSISPLSWSHATYIAAIQEYLNKLLSLEKCTTCNQAKYSKYRKVSTLL
ncbi:MAG: glycoside hydrolase family 15 protein [Gammaproteobacteria bacterium]|nr:glycoside hydrolase family 15 protein [Gammaproteobacteria bacterium]